ncbi:MAG: tail fiber assembly protein [Thermodesulfovibrionales bacterium]|nr:tail fiber assembly protein [Thermodesulfovibrionales bacterium]
MGYFIGANGNYYEGDRQGSDLAVTQRQSHLYAWNGAEWVFDNVLALSVIRQRRDALLAVSDWTQLSDSPLVAEKKMEWSVYRQALRDFPAASDPANPVWPQVPA